MSDGVANELQRPQPIRALLLSHYFEPENGAPQRRWRALIEHLVAQGASVDAVVPEPHHPDGRSMAGTERSLRAGASIVGAHGGAVHRVSFLSHDGSVLRRTLDHLWVAVASVVRASHLIRRGRMHPDVVIATAPALPTLLAGRWLARRFRLPLVIEMRDAWPDLVSHTPGLVDARSVKAFIKRRIHNGVTAIQRRADAVVTTTESFAEVLRERGIPMVTVVRNGTDPDVYEAIGPVENNHPELRVLYMGTLGRSQGLETVVRAAAILRDRQASARVHVIGAGADQGNLRSLNDRLGRPVELRAAIAPGEVFEHYRWADTCVVTLRNWGPFQWTVPSKLYELMATGRHITALLAGEAAEIVRATECGSVVPPGDAQALADAWLELISDRRQLRVGQMGQQWVRSNADYVRLAQRYSDTLSKVIEQHQRERAV